MCTMMEWDELMMGWAYKMFRHADNMKAGRVVQASVMIEWKYGMNVYIIMCVCNNTHVCM